MFYPRFHDYFVNKNVCDGPFLKVDRFQHLPGRKPISNISHESRTSSSLDIRPDGHTMAAWLDLVSDTTGWSLVDTGRMDEIVQGMSHPTTQYPSFLWFIGNQNRVRALRSLFPHNNVTRRGPAGLARLHLSTTTAATEHPVFFAESSFYEPSGLGECCRNSSSADRHRRYPIQKSKFKSPLDLSHHVHTKLFFPWTHVACFFVDSAADMEMARTLLNRPYRTICAGGQGTPQSLLHVVIVRTDPLADCNLGMEHDMRPHSDIIDEQQLTITVLDIRDRHELSPTAAFDPLRRMLLDKLHASRAQRTHHGLLFSACHLNFLWKRTLAPDLLTPSGSQIDCLEIARARLPVPALFEDCLLEFLEQSSMAGCSTDEIYECVASAILLDAYPPGMHQFRPDLVFQNWYRDRCRAAWESHTSNVHPDNINPRQHCDAVQAHLADLVSRMGPHQSSRTIRMEVLARVGSRRPTLNLPTACFFCLCRSMEHVLPCGHTMCDTCVTICGSASRLAEHQVDLTQCSICHRPFQLAVRQLPPTKRPIVITLDGGGIRGIVTLGLLRALERRLDGVIKLSQIPDILVGTSVGAVIATDSVYNGTSAEEGYRKFPEFARKAFQPSRRALKKFPWLAFIVSFLSDHYYDSDALDRTLQELYKRGQRLSDVAPTSPASPARSRVAVVASRISDGKPFVFTNYRGVRPTVADPPYEVLLPQNDDRGPQISEMFFPCKHLPGLGTLQDGGVRANNPEGIAQEECRRIWPTARTHDLLITVGTGRTRSVTGEDNDWNNQPRGVLRDGAPLRLWRAYNSSPCMDAEQAYKEGLYHVPHFLRSNTFRLDYTLDGGLPQLDDLSKLPQLAAVPYTVPDGLVRAVLATTFFFELDGLPVRAHGQYHCRGSILCARPNARQVIARVLVEFPGARFQTHSGRHLGRVDDDHGCTDCGYFRKTVAFSVPSLDEEVSIYIAGGTLQHNVGGFPSSIQHFLNKQQADAVFGRSDHQTDRWPPQRLCYCLRGLKRRVQFVEPAPERKKRRL